MKKIGFFYRNEEHLFIYIMASELFSRYYSYNTGLIPSGEVFISAYHTALKLAYDINHNIKPPEKENPQASSFSTELFMVHHTKLIELEEKFLKGMNFNISMPDNRVHELMALYNDYIKQRFSWSEEFCITFDVEKLLQWMKSICQKNSENFDKSYFYLDKPPISIEAFICRIHGHLDLDNDSNPYSANKNPLFFVSFFIGIYLISLYLNTITTPSCDVEKAHELLSSALYSGVSVYCVLSGIEFALKDREHFSRVVGMNLQELNHLQHYLNKQLSQEIKLSSLFEHAVQLKKDYLQYCSISIEEKREEPPCKKQRIGFFKEQSPENEKVSSASPVAYSAANP